MKILLNPLPVRIFHWTMALSIIVLVITGLLINDPPMAPIMTVNFVRKLHAIFGIILILNTLAQFYYYTVKGHWQEVVFLPRDIPNLYSFLRYMFFVTEGMPYYGRYNPGQKLVFTTWWLAIIIASVVSMASLFPNDTTGLQRLIGGLGNVRAIKYLITMFFVATVPWHIYLSLTEDLARLQAMVTGYIYEEPKGSTKQPPQF